MFSWFKKKPSTDEELKAKLAKSLEKYSLRLGNDNTDSTWTDIEVDGGTIRAQKINVNAIEELTLTEFEEKEATVFDLTTTQNKDPWADVRKR